ncbi:MAG: helix-turn-helix domain-containing protein [Acidobacteriota bacterium]
MDQSKRKNLEAAGWKLGKAADFLELNEYEIAYIELKLALSKSLQKRRRALKITQKDLAQLIRSSQSRVAKMEAGDPAISLDLLVKTLLALKTSRQTVARMLPR